MTSHMKALAVTVFVSGLVLAGCSSSPSEEELRQLDELKDQAAALQREVTGKEQQKAGIERELAEKNAKLKKCADDQQVVRQRLGK